MPMRAKAMLAAAVLTAAMTATASTASADHGHDLDCGDFQTQAAAQQHMDAHAGDPDRLDGNDQDGRACESNPCPCGDGAAPAPDAGARSPERARRAAGRVVRVVDGDTLRVRLRSGRERSVRLIGIDAPERRSSGSAAECGARAATKKMRRLALRRRPRGSAARRQVGVKVRLRTDPSQDRTDRYGRLLAYVERRRDDRELGRAMVRAGWATTYVYDGRPFRRFTAYSRAERKAEAADRGVFKRCGGDFHSQR